MMNLIYSQCRKYFSALALLVAITNSSLAQKENANWLFGDSIRIHFDSMGLSLNSGSLKSIEGSCSLSDSSGSLRCYSDGSRVYNYQGNIIKNADTLSDWLGSGQAYNYGSYSTNGCILLSGFNDTTVIEIHISQVEYLPVNWYKGIFSNTLIIKPDTQFLLLPKNQYVFNYDSTLFESIAAIRHANGRDWWIITHKVSSQYFVKLLLTPTGFQGPYYQKIGSQFESSNGEISISRFGHKIGIAGSPSGNLDVYDFDRCTGMLSNYVELGDPPYDYYSDFRYYGVEFSPDETKLYSNSGQQIWQFNLNATNIKSSQTVVYTNNYFTTAQPDSAIQLGQLQLAVDGKVYLSSTKRTSSVPFTSYNHLCKYLSVINNPNELGAACNFSPYSIFMNKLLFLGLPNTPWYLPKIAGSACDTICNITAQTETQQQSICSGDSTLIYGVYQKIAGVYGDTLHTFNQCDSIYRSTTLTVEIVNAAVTENNKTLTAALSNANYQWYNCDSSINITGATEQTYTPTHTGNYACIVSSNGCSSISNCEEVITGVEELQILNSKLKIYPNPNNGNFIIESSKKLLRVEVYDMLGRKILQQTLFPSGSAGDGLTASIELQNVSIGNYFVRAILQNGESKMSKLVVE